MKKCMEWVGGRRWRILAPATFVVVGALFSPAQTQRQAAPAIKKPAPLVFREYTSRLHVPAGPAAASVVKFPVSIKSQDYSVDYARRVLVPAMGGSIAAGDFDGDGCTDLYVVVPGGRNRLLARGADGTFSDVTEKARVPGSGADLGRHYANYVSTVHPRC
jgi:hypothetical protein